MKRLAILLAFLLFIAVPCVATVPDNAARDIATGNGATTAFPYSFKIQDATEILVYVNGVLDTLSTDYSVTGVGQASGGTINFAVAPTNGAQVLFLRNVPLSQLSTYIPNEAFPSKRVENDYDKVWMGMQELNEKINRAPKFTVGSLFSNIPFPDPVANKCLSWTSDISALQNVDCNGTSSSGVTAFIALSDVPNSYSGSGLKFPRVNAGATGLEFVNIADSDIPDSITLTNITQITNRSHSSLQNLTSGDDHTQYALLGGRAGGQNLALGTKTGPGYSLDTNGSINIGQSSSEGLRFGGTALLLNVLSSSPGVITAQPSGNGVTTALHLIPTSGTLPTGTLAEVVLGRTAVQAFGGNYGRWSFTALGSGSSNVSGIYGEFGGTVTPTEFIFNYGVENPPSTFTSYEPMRLMAGTDIGNVGFGLGATSGRQVIQLQVGNIGSAGHRDSHSILLRAKSNDGTEHAIDWQHFVNAIDNPGTSVYKIQTRNDANGFADVLTLGNSGIVTATTQMASPIFQTTTALITSTASTTASFLSNGVGGTGGPTVGTQNGWVKMKDSTGATIWIPVWK